MNSETLEIWNALGVVFIEDQSELIEFMDYLEKNKIDHVVRPTDAGWTVSRT